MLAGGGHGSSVCAGLRLNQWPLVKKLKFVPPFGRGSKRTMLFIKFISEIILLAWDGCASEGSIFVLTTGVG